jgi:hypothetical protein
MKIKFLNTVLVGIFLSASCFANVANAEIITVSEDASTYGVGSGKDSRGYAGLNTGGSGVARFFQKFILPTYSQGTYVQSATISIYHSGDYVANDDSPFSIWSTGDDWSETSLNRINEPSLFSKESQSQTSYNPGNWFTFDITNYINWQYQGDGIATTVLRADDESLINNNQSWEHFHTKESSINLASTLNITVSNSPLLKNGYNLNVESVPAPASFGLLALALAGMRLRKK